MKPGTWFDGWNDEGRETGALWNPLADDGDALRLAVMLGILQTATLHEAMHNVPDWSDRYAATRRAIVRAAAAIGEQA